MSDFGGNVSRTLDAANHQYQVVVFQAGRPPLDSELNLVGQVGEEIFANLVRAEMPSGWLLDPYSAPQDYVFDPDWSNFFKLGRAAEGAASTTLWAAVNGWIIPVLGTGLANDVSNRINLFPPPSSDARTDFVFLEVWLANVAANPSTTNKPSASTIWKYGNVEYGGTNLTDDLIDNNIGSATTRRLQLQYRLRVVGSGSGAGTSVDLTSYPDGLDDPVVVAQGASASPVAGETFENMRATLGDAGLWRAGDGDPDNDLGTFDGYVYAIPVCAIERMNTSAYVSRTAAGNANQNGGLDRNPSSVAITEAVDGTRIFTDVTLTSAISSTTTGAVQVNGLSGSGLDNDALDWDSVFLKLDDEVIYISGVSTATTPGTITIRASGGRGRNGTAATRHAAGTKVEFFCFNPLGYFADQISSYNLTDLRKGVTPGSWDYGSLLRHNFSRLLSGDLRTAYKQSGISDVEGSTILEVDTLFANGATAVPNQTEALDGPDGIRTVFSDAAVTEMASVILAPTTGSAGTPVAVADYTASAGAWPAADFDPSGFQPNGGGWTNGAVIGLNIGGSTLNGGARATVRSADSNRWVRFMTPREYWLDRTQIENSAGAGVSGLQTPFLLRMLSEGWGDPVGADEDAADHPGPLFPLPEHNFERPFIVLGGVVNSNLRSTSAQAIVAGSAPSGLSQVRIAGLNFDTAGSWYATSATLTSLETSGITNTLLYGQRNLFDMLTAGGTDRSGASSELYLVLTGDVTNAANCGVFRVVGAGTVGYTRESGATAADLVVERVGEGAAALVAATGLTAEVRSQYTHTQDGNSLSLGATAVVVITDLASTEGGDSSPWNGLTTSPSTSQAVLDTLLLYGPSRGGTARVADRILRLGMVGIDSAEMVREAPTTIDSTFAGLAGVASGELYFPLQHVQTWNRLPSLGLSAPRAPAYGDGVGPGGEVLREAPVFVDAGSKTLVVRPYRRSDITMARYQATGGLTNRFFPETYASGDFAGGDVDGGGLFPAGANYVYAFPWEWMPRFGRQDIPYHQTTGVSQTVYPGINHLFGDSQTLTDDVFRVIGGVDSNSAVVSLFFQTGATSGRDYGEYFSMGGSSEGYQARIYEDVTVYSSDIEQKGLKGIQLPPFLGVARLYGVYDLREFAGLGAWNSDRATLSGASGRPKNLLRVDADKQSLFIVKGGASDVTGSDEDHTYVIPQDVIDVTLSGQYVAGETFDDLEFVVECVVFGFARGFITSNNYILARANLPNGDTVTDPTALAEQVSVILPLPLPYNEQLYVVYDRPVYQGDPYMTRDGATKTTSDYENRLGQIPASSSYHLGTPIQQFDSTDNYAPVPQIPNARALEVLASLDFYTTLGTGKIGGKMFPGTLTDVGHITSAGAAPTRVAAATTDPVFQSEPRAFTQGVPANSEYGFVEIEFLTASAASADESITITRGSTEAAFVSDTTFSGGSAVAVATSFAAAVNAEALAIYGCQVRAESEGTTIVTIWSLVPGVLGADIVVSLAPAPGSRAVSGFRIRRRGVRSSQNALTDQNLAAKNGHATNGCLSGTAPTPIRMTGLTERLPLGILLQDSDFVGEDPLRSGTSGLVILGNGAPSAREVSPLSGSVEFGRAGAAGEIGMADGSILSYTPWTLSTPSGATSFRLYRGGGSAYSLQPGVAGGPFDFSAGGFPEGADPVLKGAVLAGRAMLVRNFPETAFSSDSVRSYGDELQMVIVTFGHVGHGAGCGHGYGLDGQISPTGHGEGFAAADRYRLEGLPLISTRSPEGSDPVVPLAPYDPTSDEENPDPCA